jgi:hypothetical protein
MDTKQALKVAVHAANVWSGRQTFYAKMGKDRYITFRSINANCCRGKKQNLTSYVMEVTLEPA